MDSLTFAGLTAALGNVTLTGISGAATTHSNSAIAFAIKGRAYTHAADAGVASPTTDARDASAITLVANQARIVVWCLDSADVTKAVAGGVAALDTNGNYIKAPEFPMLPDDLCPVAYTIHKAGSTTVGTWTFGTSNWNATGLTHTVVNLAQIPERPSTT